jgi:hypothetical protein
MRLRVVSGDQPVQLEATNGKAEMIALADCLAMCGLSEDEVLAIAEHEHISEIAAAALAQYLLNLEHGPEKFGTCSATISGKHSHGTIGSMLGNYSGRYAVSYRSIKPAAASDVSLATVQPSASTSHASKTGLADGPALELSRRRAKHLTVGLG